MSVLDILKQGVAFTNDDETAREMLVDFTDHKVGMHLDAEDVTMVVLDGSLSLEDGIRDDCHVVMRLKTIDLYGAIDSSVDLMEIKDKGEIIKGDAKDANTAVHFMATFPFFDAMVRLYEDDGTFRKQVDDLKAAL